MGEIVSRKRLGAGQWAVAMGAAVLALVGTGQAMAACSMPGGNGHSPYNWHMADGDPRSHEAYDSVVGLWKVSLDIGVDEIDFGTVQWHPDGTELMISGKRAPSTGDVCMGVWKKTGPRTYKLNHLTMGWLTPDSTSPPQPSVVPHYLGPGTITETITLDRWGMSYEGLFTIDQYAADGITVLAHLTGTIKGTRVTVD